MMNYSASKNAFYDDADKNIHTDWPADCIEMTLNEVAEYCFGIAPEGKRLGPGVNGGPGWVDIPPPSHAELVSQAESQKSQLTYESEQSIRPLERAKQLGIATDAELASLTEWERYSVFLMRVDTYLAPNIDWPQKPQ